MKEKVSKSYPLDNSAIIHLASMRKGYTNFFRVAAVLTNSVFPEVLQTALDHITPRFPTIVAGIRRKSFQYVVVPVEVPPKVQKEQEHLSSMTKEEIKVCAMRVLYSENNISVECFHALTDGHGGSIFLNALLAEYYLLCYPEMNRDVEYFFKALEQNSAEETTDDYITYARGHAVSANHRKVYRLPPPISSSSLIHITTGIYSTQELLDAAHYYGVSLTVFLTAVMFDAVMELQRDSVAREKECKPIQIMVPVDLRKRFSSKTLRNFSLYALPCITQTAAEIPFESLVCQIAEQLEKQTTQQYLSAMIAANVRSQNWILFRILPLWIKDIIVQAVYHFYGERNSCLSISNLGEAVCLEEIRQHIQRMDFMLTPRRNSACNCGIISYGGRLFINFTGKGDGAGLEQYFFKKLASMGYQAEIETA